jgi:DNA polymerase-3 subunit epsilon
MSGGLSLGGSETLLTARAADFLSAGPADAQSLISHVCQLPGAPANVAEHMATALFAGHKRFVRDGIGRWCLRDGNVSAAWPSIAKTLREESFAVVDVESTGSRHTAGDRITEIAVVVVKNGVATTAFESLINPDRPIPPMITALTNITSSMIRNAPRFRDVCDQLVGVLEGHIFVAHNATFDWRFINAEIERARGRRMHGRTLCTVRMAKKLAPQIRRKNLDAVAYHYGIDIVGRHRAGGDARATAEVLLRLLKAADENEIETFNDLDQLLRQPGRRKKRTRRPPAMPHSARDDSSA